MLVKAKNISRIPIRPTCLERFRWTTFTLFTQRRYCWRVMSLRYEQKLRLKNIRAADILRIVMTHWPSDIQVSVAYWCLLCMVTRFNRCRPSGRHAPRNVWQQVSMFLVRHVTIAGPRMCTPIMPYSRPTLRNKQVKFLLDSRLRLYRYAPCSHWHRKQSACRYVRDTKVNKCISSICNDAFGLYAYCTTVLNEWLCLKRQVIACTFVYSRVDGVQVLTANWNRCVGSKLKMREPKFRRKTPEISLGPLFGAPLHFFKQRM